MLLSLFSYPGPAACGSGAKAAPAVRSAVVARSAPGRAAQRCLAFAALSLALSIALVLLLMRSADRGQTLFGLLVGFALAVGIAHQVVPVPCSVLAWVIPVVTAVLFYGLSAFTAPLAAHDAWMKVQPYAQALPVDWVTFGCGGAVLGFWVSQRLHEAGHFERLQALE